MLLCCIICSVVGRASSKSVREEQNAVYVRRIRVVIRSKKNIKKKNEKIKHKLVLGLRL